MALFHHTVRCTAVTCRAPNRTHDGCAADPRAGDPAGLDCRRDVSLPLSESPTTHRSHGAVFDRTDLEEPMSSGKRETGKDARRARLAEIQAAQQRADRRRTRLVALVVGSIVLALAVPATVLIVNAQRQAAAAEAAASEPIEGEKVVEVPSATHVTQDVPYETAGAAAWRCALTIRTVAGTAR